MRYRFMNKMQMIVDVDEFMRCRWMNEMEMNEGNADERRCG